jgi:hypothetical protein
MNQLSETLKEKLINLGKELVDQQKAEVAVPAQQNKTGFWFGGGNITKDTADNALYICGRYRNFGDSRTGVSAGDRGLELAIFKSTDDGNSFCKARSWTKSDLSFGGVDVLSIEGCSIVFSGNKVEMILSTEKKRTYPKGFESYQKPGTGVWSIDIFEGRSIAELDAGTIRTIYHSDDPSSLHAKDPVGYLGENGSTYVIYCQSPFCWSSTYTGCLVRKPGRENFELMSDYIMPKGHNWDVAVTRITERLPVPGIGEFADLPPLSLYFYDGAECVNPHDQSEKGVKRVRGYSCEEISGLAYGFDDQFPKLHRLSEYFPLFISPDGTGCSRYTSVFHDGKDMIATWQKSMPDLSQPLVINRLKQVDIERILG